MKNISSIASRGQSPLRSFSTVSRSTRQPMRLHVRRNSWPFSYELTQRIVRGRSAIGFFSTGHPHCVLMQILRGAQYTPQSAYGKQKLEEWADTLRPRGFVVLGAFHSLVMQIFAEAPASLHQCVAKHFYVVDNAGSFACTDVEPDARARFRHTGLRETQDDAMIPPDRRR